MCRMWEREPCGRFGVAKFFLISLSHEKLFTFYKMNSLLSIRGFFTLDVIDEMMPWERDIHIAVLHEYLNKQDNDESET